MQEMLLTQIITVDGRYNKVCQSKKEKKPYPTQVEMCFLKASEINGE